ncbi:MAG: hypothetical protein ACI861_001640 [Paracoccaceae bacterium]
MVFSANLGKRQRQFQPFSRQIHSKLLALTNNDVKSALAAKLKVGKADGCGLVL